MRPGTACTIAALICTAPLPAAAGDWVAAMGLDPYRPLVMLPQALGTIVGVVPRITPYEMYQTIIYAAEARSSGQNQVILRIRRESIYPRVTSDDIARELALNLPGTPMAISAEPGHNALGIYGYAAGSSGGQNCVYAWQGIDKADALLTGSDPGLFGEGHALLIRIRMCRGDMSRETVARWLDGLSVARGGAPMAMMAPMAGADALSAAGQGYAMPPQPWPSQPYSGQAYPAPVYGSALAGAAVPQPPAWGNPLPGDAPLAAPKPKTRRVAARARKLPEAVASAPAAAQPAFAADPRYAPVPMPAGETAAAPPLYPLPMPSASMPVTARTAAASLAVPLVPDAGTAATDSPSAAPAIPVIPMPQ